ncbi:MAG: alpha/beta hydrolase [Solirubrobacteraceae bacterium]|nr:alpha/beta hydrolase [Solirubrobacteraceae bacterium]
MQAGVGLEFLHDSVILDDGRRLAFSTLGPADGFPIVYLHGGVGTALTSSPELSEAVDELGIQWVAVSRPGFGTSDGHPERSMLTVAADIEQLAWRRGWTQIAVVGVSTGGPYALACGAALPQLVGAVAIAASLSSLRPPHAVPGLPLHTRAFMAALVAAPERCIRLLDVAARGLHAHERWIARLLGPSRAPAVHALSAATKHGVRGAVEDFLVCARPWGFDPASLAIDVHIWHGLRDRVAPAEHAWQLAAALPCCRVAIDPDETHFFFRRRCAEIAAELVGAGRSAHR